MIKLEFDSVKLEIPTSWKDVTLSDYEKWYMLKPESKLEMIQFVASVCKIDAKILSESPVQVFNIIVDSIGFAFESNLTTNNKVNINEEDYFIAVSDKLTLAEYVDIESVLESDSETKLSDLLAIICRPAGEIYNPDITEERNDIFKNISCDKILPLISFFLFKKKKSEEISSHCLTVTDQASQLLHHTKSFVLNGVGIKRLPICQRIKYYYLTKSLEKQLLRFSASYYTK